MELNKTKTIEEAALRYAVQQVNHSDEFEDMAQVSALKFSANDLAHAFEAGSDFSLTHQWRSVEDELPEDDETVLTLSSCGHVLAYYSKQDEMWFAYGDYGDITPTHWMPIPSLNPEQR